MQGLLDIESAALPPVLFVGDHFGYPGGVAHGVTTYFRQVLPALVRAGVDLTACFLREPHSAAEELQDQGVRLVFLSAHKWNPLIVKRVLEIARQRHSRIIHSAGIKATVVARVAAHVTGARALLHVHDLKPTGTAVRALHGLLAQDKDLGICVSKAVANVAAREYHITPQRIRVVYNGIHLELFQASRADARQRIRDSLRLAQNTRLLVMVGRLHPVKGHRGMLKMMPEILRRYPDVVLALAGDGPEKQACEALVSELQVRAQVRFLGQRADIPDILRAADLLVMPSASEGLPIAAIEALAAGLPIVGFDVGGMPEVIDDRLNGRLAPAGDPAAFIAGVVELLQDPSTLHSYSANAVAKAQRFSIESHMQALMSCYREAVPGR
jgi:glycosyltransferase involved in cell wall biosynthesis